VSIGFVISYLATIITGTALCLFAGTMTGNVLLAAIVAGLTGLIGGFAWK